MKVTLSKKMYGLVGAVTLCMTIGTGVSIGFLTHLLRGYDELTRVEGAQRDIAVNSNLEQSYAAQGIKDYTIEKNDTHLSSFEDSLQQIRENLEKLEGVAASEADRSRVKAAQNALEAYAQWGKAKMEGGGRNADAIDPERNIIEALKSISDTASKNHNAKLGQLKSRSAAVQWGIVIGLVLAISAVWVLTILMVRKVHSSVQTVSEATAAAATGDMTKDVPVLTGDEVGDMARGFNNMMGDLRRIAGQIKGMTNTLASSTEEVSATTESLSQGSKEQSRQTEQAAAAITEVSQTVMDVARNASEASNASKDMSRIAGEGRKSVENTVVGMHGIAGKVREAANTVGELGNASKEIGTIINTINDIADQTNLLALNAAIEAARAGESGRGFAVVADEVRKLAERTGKATKEIGVMIEKIQQETARSVAGMQTGIVEVEKGVALAEEAKSALERIVSASTVSTDMIQRIAAAAEEQSAATEQVSANMEGIANVTRANEASVDQIRVTMLDLSRMAGELNSSAAWFKV